MADTITIRKDEDVASALAILTRDGTSISQAVRSALIRAASEQGSALLHTEAEALAGDPGDREEMAAILRDMETLRAW